MHISKTDIRTLECIDRHLRTLPCTSTRTANALRQLHIIVTRLDRRTKTPKK